MATEARQREGLPTGFLSKGPSRDGDLRFMVDQPISVKASLGFMPEGREDAVAGKCRQLLGSDLVEDCFVPKYERYMKREGAWRIVVHPMFSEYVFVSTRDVRALAKALGQLSFPAPLVGRRGRTYAPLSPSVQAWLESVLDEAHVLRASEGRIEGGVLQVERGPLRGCEGRVRKINRHKRMAYLRFDEGGEGDCVLQAALNVPVKN